MPVPSAVSSVRISLFCSILSRRARSTLRILPRKGRIAWKRRSLPCFAEPPALSPSTIYSSALAGSRSVQSASLPGRLKLSSPPLRWTSSRALRAASRAREVGVAELALGLPLELRLGQLDRDDRRQALAHVLSGERLVGLQEPVALRLLVHRPRQR